MTLTKKELEKWNKEDLISTLLIRNQDAKDYSKLLTKLENKIKQLSKVKNN